MVFNTILFFILVPVPKTPASLPNKVPYFCISYVCIPLNLSNEPPVPPLNLYIAEPSVEYCGKSVEPVL